MLLNCKLSPVTTEEVLDYSMPSLTVQGMSLYCSLANLTLAAQACDLNTCQAAKLKNFAGEAPVEGSYNVQESLCSNYCASAMLCPYMLLLRRLVTGDCH